MYYLNIYPLPVYTDPTMPLHSNFRNHGKIRCSQTIYNEKRVKSNIESPTYSHFVSVRFLKRVTIKVKLFGDAQADPSLRCV